MKNTATLVLAFAALTPAFAASNVDVSINVNQPGIYGRIDIGNFPAPRVVYAQPVVIAPAPVAIHQSPIYLYVPVNYQQNWGRYCGRYAACGQPVYFVQERWYHDEYVPRHQGCEHGNCKPEKFKKEKREKRGKHRGEGQD